MNVFDCSNSAKRPATRGSGGPVENTIVRDLKKYGHLFCVNFVDYIQDADVVFTNDVFTDEALAMDLPRVKRMDGVFFQEALKERNEALNEAAQQADWVIFISEFSKEAYQELYGKFQPLRKRSSVILNRSDPSVFTFRQRDPVSPKHFVAMASSWDRPEKRLDGILDLAKYNLDKAFHIIGETTHPILYSSAPSNCLFHPYTEDESHLNDILGSMDAMICTAFRDAAPKTVGHGISCGLPVFYADSGGVSEIVVDRGLGFYDPNQHEFRNSIPKCDPDMYDKFDEFCTDYSDYLSCFDLNSRDYEKMLQSYFEIFNYYR